jgi:hypothetical protein
LPTLSRLLSSLFSTVIVFLWLLQARECPAVVMIGF